jgi:hypothetical protein
MGGGMFFQVAGPGEYVMDNITCIENEVSYWFSRYVKDPEPFLAYIEFFADTTFCALATVVCCALSSHTK